MKLRDDLDGYILVIFVDLNWTAYEQVFLDLLGDYFCVNLCHLNMKYVDANKFGLNWVEINLTKF